MIDRSSAPPTGFYAPIEADLAEVRRAFDDRLVSELPFVNTLCGQAREYRGKMLRPALLLLAGRATGSVTEEHITLAVVVEMVHLATLVHDDVLDQAELRRRRPTINAMTGNESAVLLGDYLISHAFHLCSTLDSQYASCRIGATTNTVCEGELMQIHHRGNWDLSEAEYFGIIRRKTASLTAVCCELGARFAGAGPASVEALRAFGLDAGMAFQVIDDVLDVVGLETTVGKTLGRDLALGKPTLPTIHCLAHGEPAVAKRLAAVLGNGSIAGSGEIRECLQQTGSIEYAIDHAQNLVSRAARQLESLPTSLARDALTSLAEFIVRRQT